MVQFEYLEGDLYVGESAEENEMMEGEELDSMYRHVTFATDRFSLVFKVTASGYMPLSEDYIAQGTRTVYYPYQNEVSVSLRLDKPEEEDTLYMEDVSLTYAMVDDTMFIRSNNEPTYSETIIVKNENLYRVADYGKKEKGYAGDEFLGLEEVQGEYVRVENLETGVVVPVDAEIVRNEVASEEINGALRVHDSEDTVSQLVQSL